MTTVTSLPPQIVYWRNSSAHADSLAAALRADALDGQLKLVETSDQFNVALANPRTQMVVVHDPNMTGEVLSQLERRCPDAVLVLVCEDESRVPDEVRAAVAHCLSSRELDKIAPILRQALRRSSRCWSWKDAHAKSAFGAAAMNLTQDAVIGEEPDQTISAWNPAAQKIFGWSDAEALGRKRAEILTLVNGPSDAEMAAALESSGEWLGDVRVRCKDRREKRVHVRRRLVRDGDTKLGAVSVCAEVTAEEKRGRDSGVLFEIRSVLRTHAPLEENLARAARWLAGKAAACVIDLLNDDGTIQRHACVSASRALDAVIPALQGDFPIFAHNRPSAADVLRSSHARGLAPVPDPAAFLGVANVAQRELLAAAGVSALLAVPVTCSEKTIGVVTLLSTARVFDESDKQMLSDAAAIVGASVERVRSERRLADARDQLQSALYFKDAFLGTVSHELRTPLQAMLGWTHLMRENLLSPQESERALSALEESIQAQGKIVNDLLELSRINSGRLDLDAHPINLRQLVKQTLHGFRAQAETKRVALKLGADEDAPIWVRVDAGWFQRALWNIVSNALKFTPSGGRVSVNVGCDSSTAQIRIVDTGVGIDPQFLPRIFQSFGHAEAGTTRAHQGLGVGLAIARHVVEAHGGKLQAFSAGRDKGATFQIELPLSAVPAVEPGPPDPAFNNGTALVREADAHIALSGLNLLVVEDDPDTRELLRVALTQAGAAVVEAESAGEALAALRAKRFDALVCDIGMPQEDGYSLIRKIRQLPAELGSRTPAVALTAYVNREDRLNALRAGFQVHLSKPVDIGELLLVVKSLCVPSPHSIF